MSIVLSFWKLWFRRVRYANLHFTRAGHSRSLICIFLKRQARDTWYSLIFDIHGAAHAGRSQEYLMGRGEAPASAQINSRWVYRLWKCTFDSSQFHEFPSAHFRIKRKTNFHCHARRDRMARADRDTFLAQPDAHRSPDRVTSKIRYPSASRLAIHSASPWITVWSDDGDLSYRLLTTGSPEEWPRKCYPLKCPSIPLDPPLFISLRFFSRLDESSRTCLLANSEKSGENSLAYIEYRNCFPSEREPCGSARSPNVSFLPSLRAFTKSFSARQLLGNTAGRTAAKHLSAPLTSASASTSTSATASRASATRASFLFCRNYFPGRAFYLISAPCRFLFVGTVVLSSFHEKRSVPASSRKLFNSWRKYDTSESTEASVKEHGNAFYPRFWLHFQVARTSYVFVRNRRNRALHVDDWFVEI